MGPLKLVPQKRERLGDVLYGQILEQIVNGTLLEGSRLPSEQQMCRAFGVSRPTVREALMRLHADGLVTTRQGSGTTIRRRPSIQLTALAKVADVAGLLRHMEVRIALEGSAAALAATRWTPEAMTRITQAFSELQTAFDGAKVPASADFKFHRAVANASGNALFPELLDALKDMIEGGMAVALSLTSAGSRERSRRVLDEHQAILDAIERRDSEAADLAMRYHLHRARQRMTDGQYER